MSSKYLDELPAFTEIVRKIESFDQKLYIRHKLLSFFIELKG